MSSIVQTENKVWKVQTLVEEERNTNRREQQRLWNSLVELREREFYLEKVQDQINLVLSLKPSSQNGQSA